MRVLIPCLLILVITAIVFLFSSSTSKGLFYALIGVLTTVSYYLGQTEPHGSKRGVAVAAIAVFLLVLGLLLFF
ncbi:MAG TPA: hypothetical protein VF596_00600 [Pyrinomonadaceae bacterium]